MIHSCTTCLPYKHQSISAFSPLSPVGSFWFSSVWVDLAPDCSHNATHISHWTLCLTVTHTHYVTLFLCLGALPNILLTHFTSCFMYVYCTISVCRGLSVCAFPVVFVPCFVVCASTLSSYSEWCRHFAAVAPVPLLMSCIKHGVLIIYLQNHVFVWCTVMWSNYDDSRWKSNKWIFLKCWIITGNSLKVFFF